MYLHLGQNTVVPENEILGIFDLDTSTVAKTTRDYLKKAQTKNEVVDISGELPKAFVVCVKDKKRQKTVYLSQLATATLQKRNLVAL